MERLQKIISQAGYASRRKAEELIKSKRVTINGKIAILGDKASFNDKILINGKPINQKEEVVYYILNKPRKVVSTVADPQNRTTVIDLINDKRKLFPIGRLDWDTTGTLIITNDGELGNKLAHPSNEVPRIYRARISMPLTKEDFIFLNSDNVMIDGKPSIQKVEQVDKKSYLIELHQGSYHHVKKLFELVSKDVLALTRLAFGGISHVGNLKIGEYRLLKSKEIKQLKMLVKEK